MRFLLKNFTATRYKEVLFTGSLDFSGSGFCMLGAPRSGKTPLALALCGGERATGEFYLDDTAMHGLSARERNCGVLFGARTLFRGTVRDNIAKGLILRGEPLSVACQRAEEAAELFGLEGILELPAKKCDFLTAQKIAFLRLIVRKPRLIVMDYPVRGDSEEELQFLAEAKKIAEEKGIFLLLLTQNARHAALFSHAAVIEGGKLTAFAARENLLAAPPTLAAARLLSSSGNELYAVREGDFLSVGGQKIISVRSLSSQSYLPNNGEPCLLFCYEAAFILGEDAAPSIPFTENAIRVRVDYCERIVSEESAALYRYYLDFDLSGEEQQGKITRFTLLSSRAPLQTDDYLTVTPVEKRLTSFALPQKTNSCKKRKKSL